MVSFRSNFEFTKFFMADLFILKASVNYLSSVLFQNSIFTASPILEMVTVLVFLNCFWARKLPILMVGVSLLRRRSELIS